MASISGNKRLADDHDDPMNTYRLASAHDVHGEVIANETLARVTARCVAQWADWYEAWPVGEPSRKRQGPLPLQSEQREILINDLFDWLEEWLVREWSPAAVSLVGLLLIHNNQTILDQHDGIPLNRLRLHASQYSDLQIELERAGLPRDAYVQIG